MRKSKPTAAVRYEICYHSTFFPQSSQPENTCVLTVSCPINKEAQICLSGMPYSLWNRGSSPSLLLGEKLSNGGLLDQSNFHLQSMRATSIV